MNDDYLNAIMGEVSNPEDYTDIFTGAYQLKKKKKHKKGKKKGRKKWKKNKKLNKRLDLVEQQNDKIIALLGIMAHQLKTPPQANAWLQETVKNSAPKLIELGTEIVKGINQSKSQSTNNELHFSTENKNS